MQDLNTGLAKARRQPWLTRSTGIMAALVIACGGFLAGIKVQQNYGETTTPTGATGALPQMTARPQGTQGSTIAGKVKLVDGTTVYIETTDGRVITVKTSTTTVVQTVAALTDLSTGSEVSVQGTASGTDTVTANTITARVASP